MANLVSDAYHIASPANLPTLTQEEAANVALRELLVQAEQDHEFKAKMDRGKALKEELPKI